MTFWQLNLWATLAWLGYKVLVPSKPAPAQGSAPPAPPMPALPANPFARTAPALRPLPPARSIVLPPVTITAPAVPPATLASPATPVPAYQWLPGQPTGSLTTPNDGDTVWATAALPSGAQYAIAFDAQAIDEVGNFIGEVVNDGGAPGIANGQVMTVPLAAIQWVVPS
jgi:hypothetical protein